MKTFQEQSELGIHANSNGKKDQSAVFVRFSRYAADILGSLQTSDKSLHKDGEKKKNCRIQWICTPRLITRCKEVICKRAIFSRCEKKIPIMS